MNRRGASRIKVFTTTTTANATPAATEIDFVEDGGATEVTLTHSGFASEEISESHSHGWNGCLDSLGRYLSRRRDRSARPHEPGAARPRLRDPAAQPT